MLKALKEFYRDERGIEMVQVVVYALLGAGMAALVGYGLTAMTRGKTGNIMGGMQDIKAMQGNVTDSSTYTYTATTDPNTGIQTDATGN